MKQLIFILAIFLPGLLWGQDGEKIILIRKKVEAINLDSNYVVKFLDNDYFLNNNSESCGGQEAKGYYKNDQIKKIVYYVGLSYGLISEEYYYSDSHLIFVYEKESDFVQLRDSLGQYVGPDYSKIELVFEGRYYFDNTNLIKTKVKGKKMFNDKVDWFENSKYLLKQLNK